MPSTLLRQPQSVNLRNTLLMCQSYLNYKLQPLQLDHNFRIKFCRHVFSHILSGIIYALQCNGTFFCEGIFMHLPTILGGVLKYFFIFKKSLIKRQGRNEIRILFQTGFQLIVYSVPSYKQNTQLRYMYLQNRCSKVFEFIICFEEFLGHFVI